MKAIQNITTLAVNVDINNNECRKKRKSSLSSCADDDDSAAEHHVHFNETIRVHNLYVWEYAYKQARIGIWEQAARDNFRFQMRIQRTLDILQPIFNKKNRENHYNKIISLIDA